MKKSSPVLGLVVIVWLLWGVLAFFLKAKEIDRDKVLVKEGVAVAARCVESRSIKGVKFRVSYYGQDAIDDYISLPLDFPCDDAFIESFKNNKIKISYYENRYLGFEVGGLVVRSMDESIEEANDKRMELGFTMFLAIVASFSLLMYGRHKKQR